MTTHARSIPHAPLPILAAAFAGAMAALAGGYWDDAWHTERGRDAFLIAPHIAIYAGIAASGAALSLWSLLAARAHGPRIVLRHKPLALALVSVVATLASGPIDNAWHIAFGRDAVIWSPPHMLGIAGTLGLGAAILAELTSRREAWARTLTPVAGAMVLASAGFATVEYDTDVPQFDEVFYLPVLGFAAAVGLLLVKGAADGRWAAVTTTAIYTVFIAGVSGFLAVAGFAPPSLPLLLLPALVVDVAAARRWPAAWGALAFTLALHVAYVPVRNWLGEGIWFGVEDVVFGALLTLLATLPLFALARGGGGPRAAWPVAASVLMLLALAPGALAHDPGQGEDAGAVPLRIAADEQRIALTVELSHHVCASTQPVAMLARRAGETRRAPLTKSGCRLSGALDVPVRGRWFVYAQMSRDGRALETWLPVTVAEHPTAAADPARYVYVPAEPSSSATKWLAGIALYAAMLALLFATFRLIAAGRRDREAAAI